MFQKNNISLRLILAYIFILPVLLMACDESPDLRENDLRQYAFDLSSDQMAGRESGSRDSGRTALWLARKYETAGLHPAFSAGCELSRTEEATNNASSTDKESIKQSSTSSSDNAAELEKKHKASVAVRRLMQAMDSKIDRQNDRLRPQGRFGDFLQPFRFKAGIEVNKGNRARFEIETTENGTSEIKINPLPLPLTQPGSISGELIFGGFCLDAPDGSWNDYKGLQLKDKILLCLRYGPGGRENVKYRGQISFQSKLQRARKAGVSGIVFLGHEGSPAPTPESFVARYRKGPVAIFVSQRAFMDRLAWLKEAETSMHAGRVFQPPQRSLGQAHISTDFGIKEHRANNAGAYLRPCKSGQRVLVVGAHLDHLGRGYYSSMGEQGEIHNGADDNASGTSIVLELGLHLADRVVELPEDVNILFLHFDGEERGLLGSRHFVASTFYHPGTEAMLNLDMVGRLRKSRGISLQGKDTADARWAEILTQAFTHHLGGGQLLTIGTGNAGSGNDIYNKELKLNSERERVAQNGMRLRFVKGGHGPSDHSSFYSRKVSIAFFFTGGHKEYHTPQDDAPLLNINGMYKISLMIRQVVLNWAELKTPLVFTKALAEPGRSDFEFRVRLGIIPGDYSEGNTGLLVGDIRKEAPVAKSGLQQGDIIQSLGGQRIGNIHDLMDFLSDASTGVSYELEYSRDGIIHKVTTELMAR